ncbi:MAG: hypothetical protein JST16_11130 [Bdellovibrionales bacterium]|nr:hypothetical protein [Bdellovibrionales bacterium]
MNTRLILALGLVALSAPVLADNLNTVIIPTGVWMKHSSSVESGSRYGGRIEFANLGKNVAFDLRIGSGLDYLDYGASLKFFAHDTLTKDFSWSLGGGAVADYSAGYTTVAEASRQGFVDTGVDAFGRLFWDSGSGVGVMLELGLECMFHRNTFAKGSLEASSNSDIRYRPYVALGVPFEI